MIIRWIKRLFKKDAPIEYKLTKAMFEIPDSQDPGKFLGRENYELLIKGICERLGLDEKEMNEILIKLNEQDIKTISERIKLFNDIDKSPRFYLYDDIKRRGGGGSSSSSSSPLSDKRLKKNISSINGAMEKLEALQGVSFEWRVDEFKEMALDSKKHLGLIAQEVEKIIPEVVDMNDQGYKIIYYEKLIPMVIEAIKMQQIQLDEINRKISKV